MEENDPGTTEDGLSVRLTEMFLSIQGEGFFSGTPMHFIRFSGCSVLSCPLHPASGGLCDTDWKNRSTTPVNAIVEECVRVGCDTVCITGGEPTDQLHALYSLSESLRASGFSVMLQTSGSREVDESMFDWVCVSRKRGEAKPVQRRGLELKVVWDGQTTGDLDDISEGTMFENYYLMPLHVGDSCNAADVAAFIMKNTLNSRWRMTIQSHKIIGLP